MVAHAQPGIAPAQPAKLRGDGPGVLASTGIVPSNGSVRWPAASSGASSASPKLAAVGEHEPDVAIVDIRMPPTQTDEGTQAAHEIRRRHPEIGIVLLSQHVEVGVATQLLAAAPHRLGYLLKDRVTDPADFAGSLRRVAQGGTALDPQIIAGLLADPGNEGAIGSLSSREREVLELVAEGRSRSAAGTQPTCGRQTRSIPAPKAAVVGSPIQPRSTRWT
jgi:DNA-binding NarL/FixJ family response regulator